MWAELYGIRPWEMHLLDEREVQLVMEDLRSRQQRGPRTRTG